MIISPNRKDFWRFPVYRALIPRLMKHPLHSIQFLQKEKVWLVGERKINVKGKQLGSIIEIITRLYREIRFFLSKSYRVQFFAAKDRIERAYEEAIGRVKNDRWEVEDRMEKFPEKEKKVQQQLQRLMKVIASGLKTLEEIKKESAEAIAALQEQLDELNHQKALWEDFKSGKVGEARYVEAIKSLNAATGELVHFLNEIQSQRMQNSLDREISAKEAEIRVKKRFYDDAMRQVQINLQDAEKRKRIVQRVVQKIPNSPLKKVANLNQSQGQSMQNVKKVLF